MKTWEVTKQGHSQRARIGAVGVERHVYPTTPPGAFDLVILEFSSGREVFYRYMLSPSTILVELPNVSLGECFFCKDPHAEGVCAECKTVIGRDARRWRFPFDLDALRALRDAVGGVGPLADVLGVEYEMAAWWCRRQQLSAFSVAVLDALQTIQPADAAAVAKQLGKPRQMVGRSLVMLYQRGWIASNRGVYMVGGQDAQRRKS